ncbi:hypothetical protein HHI36_013299 [Cryptolaemus montrouzieri]|uniref:Reverse transcriptase domain-containing protein n=1 Tax=Cryptolaemus montrouzieri TaxID=559131 RepID=A0ABD2NH77_9CUCU
MKQPLGENVKPPNRIVDSLFLKPTTPMEVMKTIKSLKSKKSFGLYGITTEVLKKECSLDLRGLPVAFADDATVIFADTSWEMVRIQVEYAVNMLTVNMEKTFFVPFGIRSSSLPEYYKVLLNKNKRFPTDQLYEEAEVLDIKQMVHLNVGIDVIGRGGEELKKIDHNHQTRKNCPFLIPKTTSSKGNKSRSYSVTRVFNSMSGDLKKIVDPTRMKKG